MKIRILTSDDKWSDWYDIDDPEVKELLNGDCMAFKTQEEMTKEEIKKYLEKFK